jgi:hypothetical protein
MRKLALALGLALACVAATAQAQGYSPAANRVLERARAASGGSGWYLLRGWRETGREGDVRYETWLDPLRYGSRIETRELTGLHVHGFNGAGDWQISPTGAVTGADDRATMAQARTTAFFNGNFFFYPGRYDARGEYLGIRQSQHRAFDVLNVQPWGGKPRELWFDRSTHLLGRIVDRTGPKPVTVELSDYRRVGPVLVAFRFTVDGGDPTGVRVRQVDNLAFPPADRSLFTYRPITPPAAVQDASTRAPPPVRPREGRIRSLLGKFLRPR